MELINRDVYQLVQEHIAHKELDCKKLSMKVNGIINADVMGGIQKYEEAFFNDIYLQRQPDDATKVMHLKSLIADQIPLLEVALRVLRAKGPVALEPLQDQLEDRFAEIKASVEMKFGKRGTDLRFESTAAPPMLRQMASGTDASSGLLRASVWNRRSESSEQHSG